MLITGDTVNYACRHEEGINFEKNFPLYLEASNAIKSARNIVLLTT
jgi:hypothetical protein